MPRSPNTPCAAGCGRLLWPTKKRKNGTQVCHPCRGFAKRGEGKKRNREFTSVTEYACAKCDAVVTRPPTRGQRPSICPTCRKRGGGWISPKVRLEIYDRDDWACGICEEAVDSSLIGTRSEWRPSLDHIIPMALGGSDDPTNLRLAHVWCNSTRGDGRYEDEVFRVAS